MSDEDSLYFIPILLKAYEQGANPEHIKKALNEIARLGQLPQYREGYTQFETFVQAGIDSYGHDRLGRIKEAVIYNIMVNLASKRSLDLPAPDILFYQKICSNPTLKAIFETLRSSFAEVNTDDLQFQIELYSGEVMTAALPLPNHGRPVVFSDIEPGTYSLRLSNGRVLWQGDIASTDVIWEKAFPEKVYPMAAQTTRTGDYQTRRFPILGGELRVALYAGLETGRLEVSKEQP